MRLSQHALAAAVALMVALLSPPAAQAQQPATAPTLDQVLTGVRHNFLTYLATVPNLFADEHVDTLLHAGYGATTRTSGATTNSIFRMRRADPDDNTVAPNGDAVDLIESREVKGAALNGEQQVNGPTVAVGLFSYGALDISPDLKHCYVYQLEPKPQQLRHTTVLVVDYALKEPLHPDPDCPVTEAVSGKAFIDPATMQIMRMEQRRPQHDVYQGKLGLWSWSVDYGAVNLDGKPFWLPATISAQSILDDNPHAEWSFIATYRNYHLLTVHSTILPATAAPTQ